MRFSLFFALGYNTFGLGLIVDWAPGPDASFEVQLGPLNIWAAKHWGWMVSFLGRKVLEPSLG